MTNPVQAQTVELAANTENIASGDVIFSIRWCRDHNKWHGRIRSSESIVDHRGIPDCAHVPLSQAVSGNRTATNLRVAWPADDLENHEIEIYAVIRAEYRFIRDNAWTKLASKKASQGMDSLFRKGSGNKTKYAVVESKCTRDTSDYEAYLGGASPLSMLGKPRGAPAGQPAMSANGVRQMSSPWFESAFMQEARGNPDPTVVSNLIDFRRWMCERKRLPLRFLNVYGPPRIGGAPHFYLIAGDYAVRCQVGALNQPQDAPTDPDTCENVAISGPLRAEWGDEPYRPMEFFSLDARTTRAPGIEGPFHDFSAEFARICANDQLNVQVAEDAERECNRLFATGEILQGG